MSKAEVEVLTSAFLNGGMTRRQLLGRLLALGLALPSASAIIAACGSGNTSNTASSSPSSLSLTVQYTAGAVTAMPLLIGRDGGFFTKHGLTLTLLNEATDFIGPVFNGSADITHPAPLVAALAAAQGLAVRILITQDAKLAVWLLVQPDVATSMKNPPGVFPGVVQDLAGKKLGITVRGGVIDLASRYMATVAGLRPDKDIAIVPTGGVGPLGAAFKAKQVDAILTSMPLSGQLVAAGQAVKVLDIGADEGPVALNQPFLVSITSASLLASKHEAMRRYVAAMVEADTWAHDPKNLGAVTTIVTKNLPGFDPTVIGVTVTETINGMVPSFNTSTLSNVNEVLAVNGLTKKPVVGADILSDLIPT